MGGGGGGGGRRGRRPPPAAPPRGGPPRRSPAHVYAEAARVSPALVAAKRQVARQPRGRFGTAAFITGGLDPAGSREAFLELFATEGLPATLMLRPDAAPRRSAAEMDALAATGHVATARVPGALLAHEENPGAVAGAIRGFL